MNPSSAGLRGITIYLSEQGVMNRLIAIPAQSRGVCIKKVSLTFINETLAPQVGLEPTTFRLTAERSAIELLRNIGCGKDVSYLPRFLFFESGDDLLSRAVSSQVPSACGGLTSVFGMGTGGTLQLLSPEILFGCE